MLIIYTGTGKGKSSASVGQAIRAIGHSFTVAFAQFMKQDKHNGEQVILKKLLAENFFATGPNFFLKDKSHFEPHRKAAEEVLAFAEQKIKSGINILILDEALCALNANILSTEKLSKLINLCQEKNIDLVLSGRDLPDWLAQQADIISNIQEVKHPFNTGCRVRAGIDF